MCAASASRPIAAYFLAYYYYYVFPLCCFVSHSVCWRNARTIIIKTTTIEIEQKREKQRGNGKSNNRKKIRRRQQQNESSAKNGMKECVRRFEHFAVHRASENCMKFECALHNTINFVFAGRRSIEEIVAYRHVRVALCIFIWC